MKIQHEKTRFRSFPQSRSAALRGPSPESFTPPYGIWSIRQTMKCPRRSRPRPPVLKCRETAISNRSSENARLEAVRRIVYSPNRFREIRRTALRTTTGAKTSSQFTFMSGPRLRQDARLEHRACHVCRPSQQASPTSCGFLNPLLDPARALLR